MKEEKSIDIVCVGEALIDFIGHQMNMSLASTKDYHRFLGGSPTNVAMNCATLGLNTHLVATVGDDGLGDFILEKLSDKNINTEAVRVAKDTPTTIILVSKTTETPEFIAFREADFRIQSVQLSTTILKETKVFHTTCFALSREEARSTILEAAQRASRLGCRLSIDLNYSPKIWQDTEEAIAVIKEYCSYNPLVKLSLDDKNRLFGEHFTQEQTFDFFHDLGVDIICFTMGNEGVQLSHKRKEKHILPAPQIEKVKDATGAGDAFWSGFLYAYIKKYELNKCLAIALKLAAIKLQHIGELPNIIETLEE